MKAIKKILGTLVTVYLTLTVVIGGIVYFIKNGLDFMVGNNLMVDADAAEKYDKLKKDKDVRLGVISVIFGWPYYLVKGVSYLIKDRAEIEKQLTDYIKDNKSKNDKKVEKETEEDPEEEKEEKVCDFVKEEE